MHSPTCCTSDAKPSFLATVVPEVKEEQEAHECELVATPTATSSDLTKEEYILAISALIQKYSKPTSETVANSQVGDEQQQKPEWEENR